ncbi:MAG: hypothetical protein Q8R92_21060 [Deltaproteobacteria bacterium]|nr:hypothetical protein [Deltaproteobacteria bacterium]
MFPDYTLDECKTRVIELDAEIARLTKLSTSFSVGKKSFNYTGQLDQLRAERELWVSRYNELNNPNTANPFQGPRIVPV